MATTFGCRASSRSRRGQHIGRMPADGGVNAGIFFRQFDRPRAAFQRGADGNDFGNAGRLRAGDDFRQIRRVVGIIQMGVRVEKSWHQTVNREIPKPHENQNWRVENDFVYFAVSFFIFSGNFLFERFQLVANLREARIIRRFGDELPVIIHRVGLAILFPQFFREGQVDADALLR